MTEPEKQAPGFVVLREMADGRCEVVGEAGAELLTKPRDHGREIRAYIHDLDGHLIEVGQARG